MTNDKIIELDDLAPLLYNRREKERLKVVQCHGIFDLIHIGHIRHFRQAKELGDVLVVSVTPDRYVNKGPGRPAFTEALRLEVIASIDCVDYVVLNHWPIAVQTINLLKPDFYVKGVEYKNEINDVTGKILDEKQAVESYGGAIAYTDDIVFSSSSLINSYLSALPKSVKKYISQFKESYDFNEVNRFINGCRDLKVLVLGEAIIDDYLYCETIGKSGKEPILAAKYISNEKSAGGVLAAANHVASLSDHVTVITQIGEIDSHESFICENLNEKIKPYFLTLDKSPTIIKRRYVETYPFQKLFEVYVMNDTPHPNAGRELVTKLEEILPTVDLVIVTDYGHGMVEDDVVDYICSHSRFLAINTQKNAGNHGFNTVSKYPRADFISISENELRLDARKKTGNLQDLIINVADQLNCDSVIVTRGQSGCVCYNRSTGICNIPALTSNITDRVGAGDAVFAVTSMCVYQDAPSDIVGLIGNAVGAQAVSTVANRESINKVKLAKHLQHLLK